MKNIIKNYFALTVSYGIARGFFYYKNRKDICMDDKISFIIASGLLNPAYFYSSLKHDSNNIKLYLNGEKIIKKDWFNS